MLNLMLPNLDQTAFSVEPLEPTVDSLKSVQPILSIIVPILNEIETLPDLLAHLVRFQRQGCEVLLVDGGSDDGSPEVAVEIGFTVLHSSPGRARQMNLGASMATGSALLFLHADTRLPDNAVRFVSKALESKHWGRFDVRISGEAWMLAVVAFFMNLRSRLTWIATGDQAIFVKKSAFVEIGGFPEQPLMEDIELSRRLRSIGFPYSLTQKVTTSGRRWMIYGVWHTVWLMWRLRWLYWRGVSPEKLVKEYW